MYHKPIIISIVILLSLTLNLNAQTITKDGKEVKLNDDGTWEYVKEKKPSRNTKTLYIDDRRVESGGKDLIKQKNDNYDKESSSFSIAIDNQSNKVLMVFWQETTGIVMEDVSGGYWSGPIYLYLENGNIIKLEDESFPKTGINGTNIIEDGNSQTSKIRQSYSAFFLSQKDIKQLKEGPIEQISYRTVPLGLGGVSSSTKKFTGFQFEASKRAAMKQLRRLGL